MFRDYIKQGVFSSVMLLLLLMCLLFFVPGHGLAGNASIPGFHKSSEVKAPAPNQLPQLKHPSASIPGISSIESNQSKNQLIIHQNQPKAIIDWSSFNIGADSWTKFDQQGNSSWVALNRIWSNDPSLIFGKLTADGKIFLINQNGILFGPGSKVNVHSLIASALNISDDNFLKDIFINKNRVLKFEQDEGFDKLASVSNEGNLNAAAGGSLFLIGPRAENSGLMNAPEGNAGLAAGTSVTLAQPDVNDTSRSGYYVLVNDDFARPGSGDPTFGSAVNRESGMLQSDGGIVGVYGNTVENWGIIRSTTAYKNSRGYVELRAANKVKTGEKSVIILPVDASFDPVTGEPVTVSDTFNIQPVVDIRGLHQWSSNNSLIDLAPVKQIEHYGIIRAPAGEVTLYADKRVYMEKGSLIDVSGIVAELPAQLINDFKLNTVELRDAYGQKGGVLQGQKITTSALAGSSIGDLSQLILTQDRTAVERSIGGARRTIVDEATGVVTYNNPQTGTISVLAKDGDIIAKQGSVFDFSGGCINYKSGYIDSTKLLSGTKIYDISNAPLSIQYDKVMNQYKRTYEKFGVREEFSGLYYGGSSPLKTYVDSYTKGGDAGRLLLSAARIVLDGELNGGVTKGTYQNKWTMQGSFSGDNAGSDYDVAMALSVHRGLETPRAGTLELGYSIGNQDITRYTRGISILSRTDPHSAFLPDTALEEDTTSISAQILNSANLGTLNLIANLGISTAQDSAIRLQPGGLFTAMARNIDHQGEISVPGGSIRMITGQNLTSEKNNLGEDNPSENIIAMQEKITLGSKSRLDASGERIDNSMAWIKGIASSGFSHITGGSIFMLDETDLGQGVFINPGSVLDVSGGYVIDQNKKVSGGNAGLLDIQGSNIKLDGDLRGYALPSENGKILGGSVTLRSNSIRVAPSVSGSTGTLILSGGRFNDTGFTNIRLFSFNDTIIDTKTTAGTSLVRLNIPSSIKTEGGGAAWNESATGSIIPGHPDLIRLHDDMAFSAGPSSFTVIAGNAFEGSGQGFTGNLKLVDTNSTAKIVVSSGAIISTAPAITAVTRVASDVAANPASVKTGIYLKGPKIEVYGMLESLGGSITADSTTGSFTTSQNSRIIAKGYNRPDMSSTPKGLALNYIPVAGGNVSLSAYTDLMLANNSVIDISGSDAVENTFRSLDGGSFTFREAGDPGSLSLSFGKNLTWAGNVKVKNTAAQIGGIRGGALTINKIDTGESGPGLVISSGDMQKYRNTGFDDISLKSYNAIQFNGAIDSASGSIGRKLLLDAPEIKGSGSNVILSAPWIVLNNRRSPVSVSGASTGGALTLSGDWVDVIGATQFSGFSDVTLKARQDVRLSEVLYSNDVQSGRLAATGNLIIDADRIYPAGFYSYRFGRNDFHQGVYSDFTIHSDKKVTIQHTDRDGKVIDKHSSSPIYSAGGSLFVEGIKGIEIKGGGYLAAPLGTIELNAPGQRIYLAGNSVLTTAGSMGAAVNYGVIDESNIWLTDDKISIQNAVPVNKDSLALKGITLNADTNIIMEGALIDVAGGGSVFSYKFLPGIEGSNDPLGKRGRYIVFKDNSFRTPGQAVYLKGGGGLNEGLYSLLPLDSSNPQNARYAFMPGAYIIEEQTGAAFPVSGQPAFSDDGYPLTIGYTAVADTSIIGSRPKLYRVRTADDVMAEGHYINPAPLVSGNSGDISVEGESAIINGVFRAVSAAGYQGGSIDLIGNKVTVQASAVPLSSGFGFSTPLPAELKGGLSVTDSSLSGQGFEKINLGDLGITGTITIKGATMLETPVISLNAGQLINIESGAELHGSGQDGKGEINLNSPGSGKAVLEEGSIVHSSHAFNINVGNPDIRGDLRVDNSSITFKASKISFVKPEDNQTGSGLNITKRLWNQFSSCEDIKLISGSDLFFTDDFDLSSPGILSIDAGRIASAKDDGAVVSLAASSIRLSNSGSASQASEMMTNAGRITFNGSDISVGGGDILFAGFADVRLNSSSDVTLKGAGSIRTGGADLNITAARMTTAGTTANAGNTGVSTARVTAANFLIDAGAGAVIVGGNDGAQGSSSVPGGMLGISARRIELAAVLQVDAGTIKLSTKGVPDKSDDGIFIKKQSGMIIARGTDDAPGGKVILATDYFNDSGVFKSGTISIEDGAVIDVSAGGQGDAGLISLAAPMQGVTLNGVLRGAAHGAGKGGSFILDTKEIGDFALLNNKLATKKDLNENVISGGFTEYIDLRATTGNLDIVEGQTVTARHVRLRSDDNQSGGQISIAGTINASAGPDSGALNSNGGKVEIYAANDLIIKGTGKILASGNSDTSNGGEVALSSARGWVDLKSGGTIALSGGEHGNGGTLYLRSQRANDDVMVRLNSTVKGETAVYAEAVRTFDISGTGSVQSDDLAGWLTDAADFYSKNKTESRIGPIVDNFHLLPGIEVVSSGDINWNAFWDQHYLSAYDDYGNILIDNTLVRFGGNPGVLTLRSAGNLTINSSLVDRPTAMDTLMKSGIRDSWAFNLSAGADIASADPLSIIRGRTDANGNPVGDLLIADQTVVYTESAPVRFASGNDTIVGSGLRGAYMINKDMRYSLASYDGLITGYAGRDLSITGGAVQTATGDIDITAGRDIQLNTIKDNRLNYMGAIRTTGQTTATTINGNNIEVPDLGKYWTYGGGGDITIEAGRYIGAFHVIDKWRTASDIGAWDYFAKQTVTLPPASGSTRPTYIYYGQFSASYEDSHNTLTTPTSGLATMAGGNLFIRTGGDFLAQAGTFGAGDITVCSGGNIKGRFLSRNGYGELNAMGNIGSSADHQQIELFDSRMNMTARGEIQIGAVVNPSLASNKIQDYKDDFMNCTYTEDTSITMRAGTDVTIAGKSPYYTNSNSIEETILPATVNIDAGGNVSLLKYFNLTSSPTGNLSIIAGGDIRGADPVTGIDQVHMIMMSDIAPEYWYGLFQTYGTSEKGRTWIANRTVNDTLAKINHGFYKDSDKQAQAKPIHAVSEEDNGDIKALKNKNVEINAGRDVMNLKMYFSKKAEVTAKRDIVNIMYEGQNNNLEDISSIRAGGNISMEYTRSNTSTSVDNQLQGLIQAGPGVFFIRAGDSIDLGTLPDGIQTIGNGRYPQLGTGKSSLIIISGYTFARDKTADQISAFFKNIQTAGDEYAQLLADGKIDEGEQLLQQTREQVINTFLGTPSGDGDLNMTSSQIGTSIGESDIFIIANRDLNLGKTALPVSGTINKKTGITTGGGGINIFAERHVNVNESRVMTFYGGDITIWSNHGSINAGRGSRTAVSASPPKLMDDGTKLFSPPAIGSGIRAVTFGDNAPDPGSIYLFAPSGIIDAGEAEISGGRIILAAREVLNVQNIIFSAGSVGVAQPSSGTAGIGSISGSGSIAQTSQLTAEASGLAATRAAEASKMIEDIMSKWLDVKVIDFVQDDKEE
jgi:filamentous hemagglutinin family protein